MEPWSSLPHSQALATCPYPEPDQSSPCLLIPPLEESHVPFTLFASWQEISPRPRPCEMFRNIVRLYGEELVAPRPPLQPAYHSLSAVHDCLFNVFAATRQEAGTKCLLGEHEELTLILRRSHTGTVWFYTSTSSKRAARPKLYTKSLTGDLKLMYSRLTLVRISINL